MTWTFGSYAADQAMGNQLSCIVLCLCAVGALALVGMIINVILSRK